VGLVPPGPRLHLTAAVLLTDRAGSAAHTGASIKCPGTRLLAVVSSQPPTLLERVLEVSRVDLSPHDRQPPAWRVALATVAAIVGSLAVDAILVAAGTALFPSIKGYAHFQFSDYAKLTVIGVIIACAAWPVVTRVTSSPRWLFFRLAVLVTLFLWLPDLYILAKGQPAEAVAVLMVMHVAIAVVTYNLLVHVAAVPELATPSSRERSPQHSRL
jgi:Family of unknown function (DUF6069)